MKYFALVLVTLMVLSPDAEARRRGGYRSRSYKSYSYKKKTPKIRTYFRSKNNECKQARIDYKNNRITYERMLELCD